MRKLMYVAVLLLAGCAAQPPRPVQVVNTAPPVCSGKQQCDAMWVDAQQLLEMVTLMRIRMVTDSRLETFAPVRVSSMGGVVTKYPVSADQYEIRLRLECYRSTDCSDVRAKGTNFFNTTLSGYHPKK